MTHLNDTDETDHASHGGDGEISREKTPDDPYDIEPVLFRALPL